MFNICLLTIGKVKESYLAKGVEEYLKRLRPYAKIELQELKPESFSKGTKEKAKKIEGERLKSFLEKKPDEEIIVLDERGKQYTSLELAQKLDQTKKKIIFVIGGSLGLDQEILNKYPKFSLSNLTFTHEMARLLLLEQIYRSVTIVNGKEYHY
ncbi:MAG: 23S rRNA (pseudouridine(1915)-N(3))-methyltransferase RlmH [Planctomycetes bacterium]|jgi:23S rRNA (pseudouridine1915-N3)-methyltransferase|nr:23S rRNA (pseudouridine(1915)-N(3))-methyltransferase RlmH [Planctomycetota bacterium]